MRRFVAGLLAALTLSTPALAAEPDAPSQRQTGSDAAVQPEVSREVRLDELFQTLRSTKDQEAAKATENSIMALWLQSGSDTVDLLMSWALEAIEKKEYPLALDYLDRIIILKPDYAEGWNKRATVHFLNDDYSESIADIGRVLALEPRHFSALTGLGAIMRDLGKPEQAIEAYKKALELDPHLDGAQEAIDELEKETAGQEL